MAEEATAAPAAPTPSATPAAPAPAPAAPGEQDGAVEEAGAATVEGDGKEKEKDYKYRKLLFLFKFGKGAKKSKKEAASAKARHTLGTPEERRSQLDRDMKNSWDTLPETLRKRKQRVSRALLSEFIDADNPDAAVDDKPAPAAGGESAAESALARDVGGGSGDAKATTTTDALHRSGVYYDDEDVDDEDDDRGSSASSCASEKNEVCVYQVQPGKVVEVVTRAMFHRQDEDSSLGPNPGHDPGQDHGKGAAEASGPSETQIGEEEIYQKISFGDRANKDGAEDAAVMSDPKKECKEEGVMEEIPLRKTDEGHVDPETPGGSPAPAASSSPAPWTPDSPPSPASSRAQMASSPGPATPIPATPSPSPSPVPPAAPGLGQPPPLAPPSPMAEAPKEQAGESDSGAEAKTSGSSSLDDSNNCPSDVEYAAVGLSGRSCEESDATTVAADDTVSLYSRPQPRPLKATVPDGTEATPAGEAADAQPLGLDSEALAAVELLARAVSSDSLLGESASGTASGPASQCSPANSHSSLDNMKLHEDDSGTDVNNPSSSSSSAASSCAGDAVAAAECGEYEDVTPVEVQQAKAEPHVYEAMLPKAVPGIQAQAKADERPKTLYSAVGKQAGKPPAPGAQPLPGMYSDVEAGAGAASGPPQFLLEALSKRAAVAAAAAQTKDKQDDEPYTFMELAPPKASTFAKKAQTTAPASAASATPGPAPGSAASPTRGGSLLSKSASGCVAALSELSAQKFPPHLTAPIFYNPLVQCPLEAAPAAAAPTAAPAADPTPGASACRDDPLLRPGNKKPCPVFKPHGFEPLAAGSDSEHLTDSFDEDEGATPSGRPGLVEEPLWRRPPDATVCTWRSPIDPLLCRRSVTMETIVEEPSAGGAAAAGAAGQTDAGGQDDSRLTVREILRRFEELGGKVPSLCDAERRDAEDGPDDEEDEEKSATLREIQETLMNLEEKVRNYQCKMASSTSSGSGPPSLQLQQPPQPQPQPQQQQQPQQLPPQQPKHHHHHHHHHSRQQQRGGRLESFQGDSGHRKQSMDGWTGRVPQPPQPQPPQQQAQPQQPQPQLLQQQHHHQQHGPASMPPAMSNGHHVNGHHVNGHHVNGHHVNGHGPASLPSPLSEHGGVGGGGVQGGGQVHDGKHSLLQFAVHHFRQSPEKFEMLKTADGSISGSLDVIESLKNNKKNKGKSKGNKENEWTWKEQVDLVKFSPRPVEQSLLRLDTEEASELAVECFVCVMRYMGDLPMTTDVTEVKCVYTVLMHCHKHESLRDEVYCQLMKQTTNNKSQQPESCQRGWRLFSIVAAYFACSDTLKPYLFKYLETAAYDKRRAYHGTAMVCLQNLRKTFRYGGRKNVPSVEEITAISAGRNSKRQMYRLPGGTERVVNTRSTTVVQDVIEEICGVINVTSPQEMEEFSLYCIVEGDTFTMPLAREEYILDVTTELHKNQQVFYLIFCRSVWHSPLRLDSHLYVEVVFNQIAPDYLEGLLLVMPGETLQQDTIYEIAKMAALLHRAADMAHVPAMKETKFLLPKPALTVRDIKPAQWVNMVQSSWADVQGLETTQAKAQVLEMLSRWPLFGSSFFAVKRVSDPKERADHILALNRHGVHFVDIVTHETLLHHPFSEVISTRKVKSEDGTLFLDMKCGNLMQQRITRLQTDQAHEISRLIRQYITLQQRVRT